MHSELQILFLRLLGKRDKKQVAEEISVYYIETPLPGTAFWHRITGIRTNWQYVVRLQTPKEFL